MDVIQSIPIIALSADAMDTDVKKTLDMGFTDYITKPINVDKFIDTIDKALAWVIYFSNLFFYLGIFWTKDLNARF